MSPVTSTLAGASNRGFGMFGSSDKDWIGYVAANVSASTQNTRSLSAAYDVQGNACSAGTASTTNSYVTKHNTFGAVLWQREIFGYLGAAVVNAVTSDTSGNIYVVGYHGRYSSGTVRTGILIKYNASGVAQWQRELSVSTTISLFGNAVTVDSSGNVYVAGSAQSQGFLVKYNSSGTLQWQRKLSSTSVECIALALDSSGNPHVMGTILGGTGACASFVAKYDTSGTLIWQKDLAGKTTNYVFVSTGKALSIDSSNNVITAGIYYNNSSGTSAYVAKYNSSGTLQWQRVLYNAAITTESNRIDVATGVSNDSSGNIFVTGTFKEVDNSTSGFLVKYDSSGVLQWQKKITSFGTTITPRSVSVNPLGYVHLSGFFLNSSSGTNALVSKFVSSSLQNKTYTIDASHSITFADGSLSDAAGSLTSLSYTVTDASHTLTEPSALFVEQAGTLLSAAASM